MKTVLSIQQDKFYINEKLTYSEIRGSNQNAHGLLMNARFIQGIFDDKNNPAQYRRFGFSKWDPDENTDSLIAALPEWYQYGLRAFTVGFQGGGPCFTIPNDNINASSFSADGNQIDPKALDRMGKIISASNELGMVVIVSCLYSGQIRYLKNDKAVECAVKLVANWLRDQKFTNVILEIANEIEAEGYEPYHSVFTSDGMCKLIQMAQKESGGILVGCSSIGFDYNDKVAAASDVNIIHGNNLTRQRLYNKIIHAKTIKQPVLCNEDSQALSQLGVTFSTGVSWGYYNNITKQEPPVRWNILKGEDLFFAHRMAKGLGISVPEISKDEQYYLQGLEPEMTYEKKRWIRLASLYPETIDYVVFYKNDVALYTAYDDPFFLYFEKTWQQAPVEDDPTVQWKAVVHLVSGETCTCTNRVDT